MKKYCIAISILSFLFAQHEHNNTNGYGPPKIGVIYGEIINNENSLPVEYASISVYHNKSKELITGGITDSDGYFSVDQIPPGNYLVIIEFIGYEILSIEDVGLNRDEGIKKNLGTLILIPKAIQSDEIEVIEGMPKITFETDKLIYDTSDDIISSTTGSAEDILKKIPMVQVDQDGNITLRGNSNVKILIDGRENRGDGVDYISADFIDKVEVITSPSAEYDPEGMAGIINIILKEGEYEGINGNIKINGRTSDYGNFSDMNGLSAFLNYKKGNLDLYSAASIYNKLRYSYGTRSAITNYYLEADANQMDPADLTDGYSYDYTNNKPRSGYMIKFGGDYYFSKSLILNTNLTYFSHLSEATNTLNYYDPFSDSLLFTTRGTEKDYDGNYDFEGVIEITKKFSDDDHEFTLEFSSDHEQDKEYESREIDDSISDTTFLSETYNTVDLKAKYKYPINDKSKLVVGYDGRVNDNFDNLEFNYTDEEADQYVYSGEVDFYYNRSIHALYLSYESKLTEKLSIKPSIRFEYVLREITFNKTILTEFEGSDFVYFELLDSTDNDIYESEYSSFYPNLNITYNLSEKKSIQFGMSNRVQRPGGGGHGGGSRQIRPFPRDIYNNEFIFIGNPFLKPEYSTQYELSYSTPIPMGFLRLNTHYHTLENAITWYDDDRFENADVVTFKNASGATEYGFSFFGMIMGQVIGGTYSKTLLEDSEENYELNDESDFYNMYMQITLPEKYIKVFDFEFGFYWMKIITPGGSMFGDNGTMWADLGVSKKFMNDKFILSLGIDNLFNSGGFSANIIKPLDDDQIIDGYQSAFEVTNVDARRSGRNISLSIKFNFGELQDNKNKFGRDGHDGGGMDMGY